MTLAVRPGPRLLRVILGTSRATQMAPGPQSTSRSRPMTARLSNAIRTVRPGVGLRLFLYSIQTNAASAAPSERLRAAARTFDGTQSGNGTSVVT